MNFIIEEHRTIQVSVVIQLIDDFTFQPIQDSSIHVSIAGEKRPIRKTLGYYVFLNITRQLVNIEIDSFQYMKEEIALDLSHFSKENQIYKVRLKPNSSYPLPPDTTCLVGHARIDTRLVCYQKNERYMYKLLYDVNPNQEENSSQITIYNPENLDFEGISFLISNEEENKEEILQVVRRMEAAGSVYQLNHPLRKAYPKIGTKLFLINEAKVTQDETYFLPIRYSVDEKIPSYFGDRNHLESIQKVTLVSGKMNYIDFM